MEKHKTAWSNWFRYMPMLSVIVFLLFLIAPVSYSMIVKNGGPGLNEKRVLAKLPELDPNVDSLKKYPGKFESYFNDNFGLRTELISLYGHFKTYWIGASPSERIILGKDEWLFYNSAYSIASYRNSRLPTEYELEMWKRHLKLVQLWLDQQNIKFLLVIAPNKSTIYPEYMPPRFNKVNKISYFDMVVAAAKEAGVTVIDSRSRMLEEKKKRKIYFRTDTHWTDAGAYVAYKMMLEKLELWFPTLKTELQHKISYEMKETRGKDLFSMLGIPKGIVERYESIKFDSNQRAKRLNTSGLPRSTRSKRFITNNNNLPNAVVAVDSFGAALLPFLINSFNVTSFVDSKAVPMDVIQRERPDVFIFEVVERNLLMGPRKLGNFKHFWKALTGADAAIEFPKLVGSNTADKSSLLGIVRKSAEGVDPPGYMMFGPYVKLEKGKYTALFKIKIENAPNDTPIAKLDIVFNRGRNVLGQKTMSDVKTADQDLWSDITVDFESDG